MKKKVSVLLLMAILLTACSPGVGTVPAATNMPENTLQAVIETSPAITATTTPGIVSPQPINRDNFTDLAKTIDFTGTIEELTGKSIGELAVHIFAYSPDGRYVAFGGCTEVWSGHCQNQYFGASDSFIYVLDAKTSEVVSVVPETKTTISGLSFSRDGNKLAYATSPAKVAVWDIPSGSVDIVLWQKDDGSSYGKVAFSPNSDSVAFVFDEYLYVWSYPDGKLLTQSPAYWYGLDLPQYSADGKRIAIFTQNYGKAVAVYDTDTWQVISSIQLPGSDTGSSALSNNGKILATSERVKDDADIYLWDVDTGLQTVILDEPLSSIIAMEFTPDDQLLFVTGYSSTQGIEESFSVWDVAEKEYLGGLMSENYENRIYFSEDGLSFFDNTSVWKAGDDNVMAARKVLEDYLLALKQDDYDKAAESFKSDDYILDWYVDSGYDTSNIPLMLETICASSAQACLPIKTIRNGGLNRWGEYIYFVQFSNPDGSIFVDADGYQNFWMPVAPDADGAFKVAGYPF